MNSRHITRVFDGQALIVEVGRNVRYLPRTGDFFRGSGPIQFIGAAQGDTLKIVAASTALAKDLLADKQRWALDLVSHDPAHGAYDPFYVIVRYNTRRVPAYYYFARGLAFDVLHALFHGP